MRVCVTITGPSGCGKTLLAESLEQFARERAYGCPVEWRMFEGNGQNFFEEHRVFTIPADQGDGAVRPSGDRGDYAVVPREDGYWYGSRNGRLEIAAMDRPLVERMVQIANAGTKVGGAVMAILDGKTFYWDGDQPIYSGGKVPENCRPPRGDFADPPGVISAATAPAIHDMRFAEMHRDYADQLADRVNCVLVENPNMSGHDKTELRHVRNFLAKIAEQGKINYRLALAARWLYNAGCWTLASGCPKCEESYIGSGLTPEKQAAMWAELRDALGLEEGTATAAGIGAELPKGPGVDSEKPCFMYGNAFDGTLGFAPTPTSGKQGSLDRIVKLEQENEDLRHDLKQSRAANSRMADRNENQRQSLEHIWDFLALLADVFDRYAEHHQAKADNSGKALERHRSVEKADRNRRYARMCRQRIPHGTANTIAEILDQPETEAA